MKFFIVVASLLFILPFGAFAKTAVFDDLDVPAAQAKYDNQSQLFETARAAYEQARANAQAAQTDYDNAEGAKQAAQNQLNALNATVASLEGEIIRLQQEISRLDTAVLANKETQGKIDSRILELRERLSKNESHLFNLKKELNKTDAEIEFERNKIKPELDLIHRKRVERAELDTKIQATGQEIENLKKTIAGLELEQNTLTTKKIAAEDSVKSLNEERERAAKKVTAAETAVAQKQTEIEAENAVLKPHRERLAELNLQKEATAKKLSAATEKLKAVEAQIQSIPAALAKLETTLTQTEAEKAGHEREKNKAQTKKQALAKEIDLLSKQIDAENTKMAPTLEKIRQWNSEKQTAENNLAKAKSDLSDTNQKAKEKNQALSTLAQQKSKAESDLSTAQAKIAGQQAAVRSWEGQVSTIQSEVNAKQSQLAPSLAELQKLNGQKASLNNQIQLSSHSLDQVNQAHAAIPAQISTANSKKQAAETQAAQIPGKKSSLQNEIANEQSQIQKLNSQIAEEKGKKKPNPAHIAQWENEVRAKEAKVNNHRTALQSLDSELGRLQSVVASEQQTISRLQRESSRLEAERNRLQSEMTSLRNQVNQVQSQITAEEGKVSSGQAQLGQLENRLRTAKGEWETARRTLSSTESDVSLAQAKLKEVAANQQGLSSDLTKLNEKAHSLSGDINNYEALAANLKNKIANEQTSLAGSETKIRSWKESRGQLEGQSALVSTSLDEWNRKIADCDAKLLRVNSDLQSGRTQLQLAQNQLPALKSSVATERAALSSTQAEIDKEVPIVANSELRLKKLAGDKEQLTGVASGLSTELGKVEGRVAMALERLKSIGSDIDSTATKLASAKNQQGTSLKSFFDLQSQRKAVEDELKTVEAKVKPQLVYLEEKRNEREKLSLRIEHASRKQVELNSSLEEATRLAEQNRTDLQKLTVEQDADRKDLAEASSSRDKQAILASSAQADLDLKVQQSKTALAKLDDAKTTLGLSGAEYNRQAALTQQAADYLATVTANYRREREKVIRAAKVAGRTDGEKEALERAIPLAAFSGKSDAEKAGLKAGLSDAASRDEVNGYLAGRKNASTDPALVLLYTGGLKAGSEWADSTALKEEVPRGYNEALRDRLSSPPSASATVDISSLVSTDPGVVADDVSTLPKSVSVVEPPQFGFPIASGKHVPVVEDPAFGVPTSNQTYFSPPCASLVLAEFEPVCRKHYGESYLGRYAESYQAQYLLSYRDAFSKSIQAAYDGGYSQTITLSFNAGLERGAKEAGTLQGYADRIAAARKEQYAVGQKSFADRLSGSTLVVVSSVEVVDENRDALFTPSEKVSVKIVVDNYGGVQTELSKLRFRMTTATGLVPLKVDTRALPSLAANTRTTLTGVLSGSVAGRLANQPIQLEGQVEMAGAAIGNLSKEDVTHFPIELQAVTLAKSPAPYEAVAAKFTFRNLTKEKTAATSWTLGSSPQVVLPVGKPLDIPELEAGEATEVDASIKPGVWVGENTQVGFLSQMNNLSGFKTLTQVFPQVVPLARSAALELFDAKGKPVPDSTFEVAAGGQVTFYLRYLYKSTQPSSGPYVVRTGAASHAAITLTAGNPSLTFGQGVPGTVSKLFGYTYTVPAALKGNTGYVTVYLSDGKNIIQAVQVFLAVK